MSEELGSTPAQEQMEAFAATFPSLAHFPFVRNWDALAVDEWACSGASHGERLAAQFVLRIWDYSTEWKCGRFDPVDAVGVWDIAHWQAFQIWAKKPFTL